MSRVYHIDGSQPAHGQIFVFGSNLSGIHGGGAARAAHQHYGAVWGAAEGQHGQSYALPTVQIKIAGPLSLDEIRVGVDRFIAHAQANHETVYFVTRVGCVLAGHKDADIAPMFANAPANCSFPENWRPWLDAANTTAPGLPALLAELFAAAEKRRTTPTNQPVPVVLPPVTLTEVDCEEADMCIHRWKLSGGPARDHQARAMRLQINDKSGRFA